MTGETSRKINELLNPKDMTVVMALVFLFGILGFGSGLNRKVCYNFYVACPFMRSEIMNCTGGDNIVCGNGWFKHHHIGDCIAGR